MSTPDIDLPYVGPVSLDCWIARTPDQHGRCVNQVRPGNRSDRPLVPCGCECHDSQPTDSYLSTPGSTVPR